MSGRRPIAASAPIVLDAGGALAFAARDLLVRSRCLAAVAADYPVWLPTVVYAQVERGGDQFRLTSRSFNELLALATPLPLTMATARQAGWLLRDSQTTDVVDAVVVAEAVALASATIPTSDRGDIDHLLSFTANRRRRGVRVVGV